jgi:hypothetical protein
VTRLQIVHRSSPGAVRDTVRLYLWWERSSPAPCAADAAEQTVIATLTYGGATVARVPVEAVGATMSRTFLHAGPRLAIDAFDLGLSVPAASVRGRLEIVQRTATAAEAALADQPADAEPLAGFADLLAIRNALRA